LLGIPSEDEIAGRKDADKQPRTLFLINPAFKYKHYGAQDELSRLMGKKKMSIPLALPLIAALTPSHYRIRIIDDETDTIAWDEKPDLVGITTLVSTIDRAYVIADRFRSNGVPVVMGGPFATFMSDEALLHADAVVVGEAEGSWQALLSDFENGKMDRVYSQKAPSGFNTSPIPRWDLVKTDDLMTLGVQASRGCPYNCEFCLVNKMFGHRMRYRDPDDVIDEIKALPLKKVFFVDDNLTIKKKFAKELIKKLRPLSISWVCQCSIDVADDDELLSDMAESGCLSILIGFESLRPESLKETHKTHNRVEEYGKAIAKIHSFGINVLASFVVGFDADTTADFDHIVAFAEENNVLYTMLSVLAAAPGTDLYQRMEDENRLVDCPRDFINGAFPCMRYKHFSQTEILEKYFSTLRKLQNFSSLRKRALALFETGAFAKSGISEKVCLSDKISTSALLVRRFLFSSDKEKRALFKDLFGLIRKKKVSAEAVVVFLLSMQAIRDYLDNSSLFLEEVRQTAARMDAPA
jgi:radical SAM superfamily enzyme YgiQ (UPF0313 family)